MNSATKGFIKAAFVLSIILVVMYVIGYKNWENQGFDDNIDYSEYMEKPQLQPKEEFTEEKAKQLYSQVNYKMVEENYGAEFFDIYYNQGNITNEFMLYLAVVNLNKKNFSFVCNNEMQFSKEEITNKIKELFGENIEYLDTNFNTKDNNLSIKYLKDKEQYIVSNNECSGIDFGIGHVETEYLGYQEKNKKVEITEYVYYLDYEKDNSGRYIINYYSSLNNNGEIIAKDSLENEQKRKLMIYKLIFEEDEKGNYVLKRIEKK